MSYVRTTRIPMSSNRRTIPPPQAEPLPCEYVNIPPHNGMAPRPDPGAGLGGYTSTFKLLAVQDLQRQVTCLHSIVRWPRRASRTSDISNKKTFRKYQNLFYLKKSSKKPFESFWKLNKVEKRKTWTQNILKSLEISQNCRYVCKTYDRHTFFYKIKLELSRHSCAQSVCNGLQKICVVPCSLAHPYSQKSIKWAEHVHARSVGQRSKTEKNVAFARDRLHVASKEGDRVQYQCSKNGMRGVAERIRRHENRFGYLWHLQGRRIGTSQNNMGRTRNHKMRKDP